ncbi:FtsX-like permease family protein [Microbacterium sp. BWT-B31]|uniref:ABC transporter permease n=1 Tax=Microbacterium sp. BWT-B31 TaxID=3232072 RepID=UPI0035295F95
MAVARSTTGVAVTRGATGVAVVREAWASVVSQPVASVLTTLMIVGMVLVVMLTTGRTVGAEQAVLGSIDDAGTRTIQVRAENGAGLTADVLERISHLDGIEWAAAFSSAVDATNTGIPDGTRVPVRLAYGMHLDRLGIPAVSPVPGGLAYASTLALDQLGLPDVAGSVTTTTGTSYAMAGRIETPDFLAGFEPVVLAPQPDATGAETVNVLVVIAERPDLVAPVSDAVLSVLAADDPTKVTVQTSEALAQLRAIVQSQLGGFSRGLVLVLLAVTGILVAVILYGLVMMRRKDFGRRRALGATRGLIVGLLLTQTAMLAVLGVGLGVAASVIALVATGDPLPGWDFTLALGVLALATAVVAALIPAVVAARREPIRELRVP